MKIISILLFVLLINIKVIANDVKILDETLGEGDEVGDDIGITVEDYEGDEAIIYDKDGNKIGVQVARSKTGPGGPMQDTILYHKSFQLCLAKQTKIQGKCG